ncbi:MAG: ATP-binding protein [Fibrobacteres bacterium]|nr:ATP-binding protein [Fibrobacterota bacterium]
MEQKRYISDYIKKDLKKKMVFLGGPRQVGKTTLSKTFLESNNGYLNWDLSKHRAQILKGSLPDADVWVFDELHKYRKWRGWIKGLFDTKPDSRKIIVTGSARLDYYRYGGDSLQGRYHFWRLHPLSVKELGITKQESLERLLKLGGFPEPYFSDSETEAKRWSREYRTRLIQEDIISVETVKDIGSLELLVMRLPELVGSPLSLNSLREDLQLNHTTIDRWVSVLERMYSIFRIPPFGPAKIRAVKKEQKHYHYDWSLIKDPGMRFENMVGCHLLKWIHFMQDSEGREIELRYFKDVYNREVDFVITEDGRPIQCVECKLSDRKPTDALLYFKSKFPECEAIQVTCENEKSYVHKSGIKIIPALIFLDRFV